MLLAAAAEPDAASRDERVLLGAATRAGSNTLREAQVERVLESTVNVRKVEDCFFYCVGRFHPSNLRSAARCVMYVVNLPK